MQKSEIDEIHEQTEQRIEEKEKSTSSKIPIKAKWILGIATIIVIYFIFTKRYNLTHLFVIISGMWLLIYLIYSGQSSREELNDIELKTLLYQKLKWYQDNPLGDYPVIPEGKIKIKAPTKKRWLERVPWKKVTSFSIMKEDFLEEEYTAEQDIKTGDIITIKKEYFDGREAPDVVYIRSPEVEKEKRYREEIPYKFRR